MIDRKALELAAEKLKGFPIDPASALDMAEEAVKIYEQARRDSLPQDRVERVAVAICPWFNGAQDSRDPQEVWDDMFERFKTAYRDQARAALLAADDAEALVAKLEAINDPWNDATWSMGIDEAIRIIRDHFAGRAPDREAGDACKLGVNTRPAPTTTKEEL
jgi:hypothetical protein